MDTPQETAAAMMEGKGEGASGQRAVFARCYEALAQSPEEAALRQAVCQALTEPGGFHSAWIGVASPDGTGVVCVAQAGFEDGQAGSLELSGRGNGEGAHPMEIAILTGQACVAHNLRTDPRWQPWRAMAIQQGYAAMIALPILVKGQVAGGMAIHAAQADAFGSGEVIALEGLASSLGHAIRNLRAHAEHMQELEFFQFSLERLQQQIFATDQHAIISITDASGKIVYVNERFCKVSQYPMDELLGRDHRVLNSGHHSKAFFKDMWDTITSGQAWRGEVRNRRKDGECYWVESTIVPVLGHSGMPEQYVSIRTEITRIKQAEEELKTANEVLEQRVSQRTDELVKAKSELEADIRRREWAEGTLRQYNAELKETNRKLQEAQNQLLQSEKMASIGQLAAGVAHEINNPIGYVYSNLGSLEKYIRDLLECIGAYEREENALGSQEALNRVRVAKEKADLSFLREDLEALLGESREGITRVKKIVQDLKDFSHADTSDEWGRANLHKGLDSTLNIAWNEIKYKAEIRKEYGELPEIECLPSQLNQVFMNLLVNAAHAMEARGVITIRSGVAGEEAWVEIRDTGTGIPPENLNRIFDPFFTTKPVGKGTGLGLSLSYSIVKKHHGRIEVESEAGKGSTFRVWLPLRQGGEK